MTALLGDLPGLDWRLKSAGAAQSVRIPLVPAAPKKETT